MKPIKLRVKLKIRNVSAPVVPVVNILILWPSYTKPGSSPDFTEETKTKIEKIV